MNRWTNNLDLGLTIITGACNAEAKDLAIEFGQLGLVSLLDDGVLKEIPVLKSILACHKTWETIHDKLFLRKVATFIAACPKFTEAEKESFAREHLDDPKKAKQLGEAVVLVLDKLDDLEKPEMVAKAFAALVRGKLPLEAVRRVMAAIDIGFVEDLRILANDRRNLPGATVMRLPNLLRTGLADFEIVSDGAILGIQSDGKLLGPKVGFKVSVLGRLFIGCMNEDYNFNIEPR